LASAGNFGLLPANSTFDQAVAVRAFPNDRSHAPDGNTPGERFHRLAVMLGCCACFRSARAFIGLDRAYVACTTEIVTKESTMAWTTPTLVEICIGLEINGYLPAEF
jgi:coenzyme PQQ precursor peptide PqqA